MNRRDFFQPRYLAQTAGQVLGAVEEAQKSVAQLADGRTPETTLVRMSRRAMATSFELLVPFGTTQATELGAAAFDVIDELESQLTAYRPTSDVCRINRLAPYQSVRVEAGLFGLLSLANELTIQTEGAFDISAGALIKAWGFFRGPKRVPSETERLQALERVGMRHVLLQADMQCVRFVRPGVEFNLGAIGKGYALDRVMAMLAEKWGLAAGLLHGGSSSMYAKGHPPGDSRGWLVSLRHPWEDRRLAWVRLRDRALGTSAATYQHLEFNGRKLGHILDPRSGRPAEGMASVSVLAPSAAQADALSTAFFVGGLELARRYCATHPEIGAILLPGGNRGDAPPELLPEGPEAAPVLLGLTAEECIVEPAAAMAAAGPETL
jgi:thiamine biosynthesis lipoprotein